MRKLFIIIIILIATNILLFSYYKEIIYNKNTYEYVNIDEPILINYQNIELNKEEEFKFSNFFKIINSNNKNYKYYFDNGKLYIEINKSKYEFEYKINEPVVIEKVIYKEKENASNNYEQYIPEVADYFYVNNDYLEFSYGTSLDDIRQVLMNNINTNSC